MIIVLIAVAAILLLTFIITLLIHRKQFGRRIDSERIDELASNIEDEIVNFYSKGNKLTGHFYYKKEDKKENEIVIILVNGYGLTHKSYELEIEEFVKSGYTVFAYDMRGCGESCGKELKGISQFVIDAQSAVNYINSINVADKIVIVGHSTGGYAAAALLNIDNIKIYKTVIIAGFNSISRYIRKCTEKNLSIFSYLIGFWVSVLEHALFGRIAGYTGIDGINKFLGEVLVIQGNKDDEVYDKDSLYSMYGKVKRKNAKFMLVENADHYPMKIKKNGLETINKEVFSEIVSFIVK